MNYILVQEVVVLVQVRPRLAVLALLEIRQALSIKVLIFDMEVQMLPFPMCKHSKF